MCDLPRSQSDRDMSVMKSAYNWVRQVHAQGAGQINIAAALVATVRVTPAAIAVCAQLVLHSQCWLLNGTCIACTEPL